MYYFDPHEIISSHVTPLMDETKRAREFIVEISLNDAPVSVTRLLSVPSNLYVGHLPMHDCFERGGYEVQPDVDTVAPEASDVLIEASVKNL